MRQMTPKKLGSINKYQERKGSENLSLACFDAIMN